MRTRGEQQWLLTNASGQFKIQTSKRTCQSPSPPPSNPYYNWSVVLHPDSVNKGYTISRILSCRRIIWPEHQLVLIIAVMPACKCPCDDKIWKQIKKKKSQLNRQIKSVPSQLSFGGWEGGEIPIDHHPRTDSSFARISMIAWTPSSSVNYYSQLGMTLQIKTFSQFKIAKKNCGHPVTRNLKTNSYAGDVFNWVQHVECSSHSDSISRSNTIIQWIYEPIVSDLETGVGSHRATTWVLGSNEPPHRSPASCVPKPSTSQVVFRSRAV